VTRGLAAMELRARGAEARPALAALTSALRDPDANVRLMSANAIAAIGPGAAPAVPDLIAACSARDEVHVLRACATALGAIGRPATAALPVLREIARQPRVRWAAEAAIRAIGGGAR
jgi:HEAT repeat protein